MTDQKPLMSRLLMADICRKRMAAAACGLTSTRRHWSSRRPALTAKRSGVSRAGPNLANSRDIRSTPATLATALTITMSGSRSTGK